jgi:hypothetical protein
MKANAMLHGYACSISEYFLQALKIHRNSRAGRYAMFEGYPDEAFIPNVTGEAACRDLVHPTVQSRKKDSNIAHSN